MERPVLSFAVVCSSNQNRSMEAHSFMAKRGFNVRSFGSGNCVKLPGPAADRPNVYSFDVSYDDMYRDLYNQDQHLYTSNGLLNMLDRNRRIKIRPERFQDNVEPFDVIICCEERVFDQVTEHLAELSYGFRPAHVINMDILDNHDEATVAAFIICELCQKLQEEAEHLDDIIGDVVADFDEKYKHRNMYHHVYYV
ncbi:RNA polymerase II subunit A C-terminal domain phosphatase SSU72-like [Paramacrobiotus metropolitanus]|uniref:RNA polymerase II subunit A C-terminal domain phosphatase SSU72-like n=1 Tax=Paramacrobiotus metropolitanus TaxID=2943436 RepID=UPI00244585E2|nr:RNA polymerase II subunit A C-terminal domain phosphatase SSU72-like [Paramacrobiotus metropolitanus]